MMKKNYLYIIIAALVMANIFTLIKISNIENSMDRNIQQMYNTQNDIRNEINNIYLNVDEKLKKQASILDNFDIEFGEELNADNLTVPVSISLTPKEITGGITATLLINDVRHSMINNGTTFTASVDVYIFEPLQIKVIMDNGSKEEIETIDEYDDLKYKYILDFYGSFLGDAKYSAGKYQYNGDIVINYEGSLSNNLKAVSITKYINGKLIDEQEVNIEGNTSIFHPVKEEVELSANDIIETYIVALDKYGLNYKYIVLRDEIDSNGNMVKMSPEWTNGSLIEIKDKSGKVLLENKY